MVMIYSIGVILLNVLYITRALVIYVDPDNGIENHKSWTGGIQVPYKNYELANESTLYNIMNTSTHVQLTSSSDQPCQQDLLDALQNLLCIHHKHIFDNDGALLCIDNVIYIRQCDCVTYDNDHCSVLLGTCPYGCGFMFNSSWSGQAYNPLPKNLSEYNHEMCGRLNRDGQLCSKCIKDFSPLVYSYELKCIACHIHNHYGWLKFVAVALIPLTFFYFVVILFRIDATSPYLYGFITLNQALASPISLRGVFLTLKGNALLVARLLTIPYTIWNLDFFRSLPLNICLDLTTLQTLALDYAIAIYPLLLVLITYIVIELHARGCRVLVWLWRPFHGCCVRFSRVMDIQSSIIKAFATFLLLSYVKLLNVTLDILLPIKLYHFHPNRENYNWYVFYDASYRYFGKDHLPYALMSIGLFLSFGLFPLILLIVYPMHCFQERCCGANNYALRTFVDTFQGHYKDGTEPGSRDCRWFAGIYFLGRILVLYVIFGAVKNAVCYTLAGFSLMVIGMLIILLQPFKSSKVNTYHTLLPFIMAIGYFCVTLIDQVERKAHWMIKNVEFLVGIFCMSPIVAMIVYIAYRCYRRCRTLWLKIHRMSPELENLVIGNRNRADYQAINID